MDNYKNNAYIDTAPWFSIEIYEADNGYYVTVDKMGGGSRRDHRSFVAMAPQALADQIAKLLQRKDGAYVRPFTTDDVQGDSNQ